MNSIRTIALVLGLAPIMSFAQDLSDDRIKELALEADPGEPADHHGSGAAA